jgi:hypothetical protein
MAKAKNSDPIEVVEVEHPGEDADASFLREQNEALLNYKLTGEAGVYIDPTRDQEPDIAPELGVSPHPDLANPAPPASSFSGRALDVSANPMLKSVDEKEEDGKEAAEAFNERLEQREEAFKNSVTDVGPAPMRVIVVDEEAEAGTPVPALGSDESVKTAQGDPSAQLATGAEGGDADSDKRSDNR